MSHRRPLPVQARRVWRALVLSFVASLASCTRGTAVTVLVDTTSVGGALEVIALPISPERAMVALPRGAVEPPGTPRADSIRRMLALADSIDRLDQQFQSERTELNEEALRLAGEDRFSDDHARRYHAHRRRMLAARELRASRDRLRERALALRHALGAGAPPSDSAQRAPGRDARRSAYLDAYEAQRTTQTARVRAGIATLALAAGTWWIGAARHDGAPDSFTRIVVAEGARDTLRVAPPRVIPD